MSNTNINKLALIILDGWGIGQRDNTNPLYVAKLPNLERLKTLYPYLSLQASGLAVGLPWGEEGNSEIGHLTIGSGRIIYQSVTQIDDSIASGVFFENKVLLEAFQKAKQLGSSVCFAGLLGTGITHSSMGHITALIKLADSLGVNYKLHLFTDGRDSSTQGCLKLIPSLPEEKIGSISGRFYAMDRDGHIDRNKSAFTAMTSNHSSANTPSEYLRQSYASGVTDEFIRPATFGKNLNITPDDSIIFFNFRKDRMEQISQVFRTSFPQSTIVSFVKYKPDNGIPAAFYLERATNTLPEIISNKSIKQLRVTESEKRVHVTYFFNGKELSPYPNEFRVIIPSKKIGSHDQLPEMMAKAITLRTVSAIEEGIYGFILVNYANPDMVSHTGNFEATIKAAECLDKEIGIISEACLQTNTTLIITSDHGNAEKMIDARTGEKDTKHNTSPVPFIVVDNRFLKHKTPQEIRENEILSVGTICDIAPTILHLMGIAKPIEMTGQSLTSYF